MWCINDYLKKYVEKIRFVLFCVKARSNRRLLLFKFNCESFAQGSFEGICLLFGKSVSTQGNVRCIYKKVLKCIHVARVK